MASARSQSTPLNQSAIPLLSMLCLRWIIFVPIENFFFFYLPFSCYFSEGQCPRVSSCLSSGHYYYYYFSAFLDGTLLPSHPTFVCLNLQDPADSGALTRPHLHRRRVFQRRANRLWQRPKVSKTARSNKTQQDKALHFSARR